MRAWVGYVATLLVVGVFTAGLGAWMLDTMLTKARDQARAEVNAQWSAEIEKSNAEIEKRLRLQAMAAQAADAAARDKIEAANLKVAELERANENLPVNACGGLGRARVELLYHGPK